MIGNDIVDLALAKKESNWKRNGYLDKIFTSKEQFLIKNAVDSDVMVWNLWTRKEAAYKIFNRETGKRGFFPLLLECILDDEKTGKVVILDKSYFTKTIIDDNAVYTVAVIHELDFKKVSIINPETASIVKKNSIPFIIDAATSIEKPISITHHGRFWKGVMLVG